MATLKLNNTTVFTESNGAASIPSAVKFPAGHVVQVVELHDDNYVTINAASIKCYDVQITTKQSNSKIYVIANLGHSNYNHDVDRALAMGYKVGGVSTNSSDYIALQSSKYTRQIEGNLGSFWTQDTGDPGGGSWSGTYGISSVMFTKLHAPNVPKDTLLSYSLTYGISSVMFTKLHAPNVPKDTLLSYSLWGSSDGTFYIGTSNSTGGGTPNGYDNSITLMEISNG